MNITFNLQEEAETVMGFLRDYMDAIDHKNEITDCRHNSSGTVKEPPGSSSLELNYKMTSPTDRQWELGEERTLGDETPTNKVVPPAPAKSYEWDVISNQPPPMPIEPPQQLDSASLPYDVRIHAASRAKTQEGKWKKKRGVTAELVKTVEDELMKVMSIAAIIPPRADLSDDVPTTYVDFLKKLSPKLITKLTTMDRVNAVLNKYNMSMMPMIAHRPDLIPQIWKEITTNE